MKEYEEKISNHPFIKELQSVTTNGFRSSFKVVGGAIIDIIEDREPKDYDIIDGDFKRFLECGAEFITETSNSTTLLYEGKKVQLLKTNIKDFDFIVSQSYILLSSKEIIFYLESFDIKNKLLRPVCYVNKEMVLNSLARIPHWKKKGYDIKDSTYYSLLNSLNKSLNFSS